MKRKAVIWLAVLMSVNLGVACSTQADYVMMNKTSQEIVAQAQDLMASGKKEEAVRLLMQVEDLHPSDPKIDAILSKLTPAEKAAFTEDSMLGFNKSKRAEVQPTTGEKVLWYLPDRILDLLDVASASLDFGPQIGIGVWYTRAAQVVVYAGSTMGIGWYQKRNLGTQLQGSAEIGLGPIVASAVAGNRLGTGGIDSVMTALWFHKPSEHLYQDFRDYWAVGFKVGALTLGVEAEIHLVELFDFFVGLATFDPLGDDFAHTRRLVFADSQKENMTKLQKMKREAGEEGIEEYKKKYPKL